jgi:RNA polymerase sigma-70 factor (ECF subfamily)
VNATTDPRDVELLERAGQGDAQAVDELFDRYREYLRAVVALRMDRQMQSRVDASDVVQETYLQTARRMDDFLRRRPMPFRLWLRKSACECLIQLRRRHVGAQQRTTAAEVPLPAASSAAQAALAPADSGTTPSQQLVKFELAERVRQAMGELDEQDREILLMRTYEGLTNQEVSLVLELEADAASKRYGRALIRLRNLLVERGVTEWRP